MAREAQGRFLGVPYNWQRPSRNEVGRGVCAPTDDRVLAPKNFGMGWTVNLHALGRRLRGR